MERETASTMDGRGVRGRSPKPHGEYEGWGRVVYRVQGTGGSVHALSPWSIIAYGYFHVAMIADGYYSHRPPLTMVGRRTKIEAESFALLVRYLFWNRVEDPEAPLFRRRSMGDRDTGGRMVRIQDLTQEIKTIAILERVEAVHVAANCFRKGYVTTCTA